VDWAFSTPSDSELFRDDFAVKRPIGASRNNFLPRHVHILSKNHERRRHNENYGIAYAGTLISFLLIDAL